jgi:hypothetical protein
VVKHFLSVFLLLGGLLVAGGANASATYTYTGTTYDPTSFTNYTSCSAPTCGTFTTAMRVTGTFTVSAPLPANQSLTDISAQLVSWSFNNGIGIVSSSGTAFIDTFQVATDSSGNISDAYVGVNNWQTTVGVNSYFNSVVIFPNNIGGYSRGDIALKCTVMGSGNACSTSIGSGNASQSEALSLSAGSWPSTPTPAAVPTLSEWSQLLLGLMVMMLVGWHFHRERSY